MSLQQCAEKCEKEIHCKSFEYSTSKKLCKINHASKPNKQKFLQFSFCQKEGENFFIHDALYTQRNNKVKTFLFLN